MFDGAKTMFSLNLLIVMWGFSAVIWVVSDQSPIEAAKSQIEIMDKAFGD